MLDCISYETESCTHNIQDFGNSYVEGLVKQLKGIMRKEAEPDSFELKLSYLLPDSLSNSLHTSNR